MSYSHNDRRLVCWDKSLRTVDHPSKMGEPHLRCGECLLLEPLGRHTNFRLIAWICLLLPFVCAVSVYDMQNGVSELQISLVAMIKIAHPL